MKTIVLASVFAAFLFSNTINAQNVKMYSNIEHTENGTQKEYISVDSETFTPQTKQLYLYDSEGKIVEKVLSKWRGDSTGWVKISKHEYTYKNKKSDLVSLITYTKWNKSKKDWTEKSELIMNVYDEENNYMATLHK